MAKKKPAFHREADHHHQGGIQVIARSSRVMRALSANPQGLSLGEIAAEVTLPRSTVQRIINALLVENLVEAVGPGGGYRLGPALGQMIYQTEADITGVVRPHLERLSQALGETVCLSRLSGRQTSIVDVVVGEQILRIVPPLGITTPLHIAADGKAMLARMSDAKVLEWLDGDLPPRTRNSKNLKELLKELTEIRATGFAYDNEEHTEGVSAIAMALGTYRGTYAISVVTPTPRMTARVDDFRHALKEAPAIIERLVGLPGP